MFTGRCADPADRFQWTLLCQGEVCGEAHVLHIGIQVPSAILRMNCLCAFVKDPAGHPCGSISGLCPAGLRVHHAGSRVQGFRPSPEVGDGQPLTALFQDCSGQASPLLRAHIRNQSVGIYKLSLRVWVETALTLHWRDLTRGHAARPAMSAASLPCFRAELFSRVLWFSDPNSALSSAQG